MSPDISTQSVNDTHGSTPPDVEPVEFEEIVFEEIVSEADTATGENAKSEPAQPEAAPGWFSKGRKQKQPRTKPKRRRRKRKPLIVEQQDVPLTWQQDLHHRLFGNDGAGLGTSLLVHIVLLLLLSIQLATQTEGDEDFTSLGSFSEAEENGFDDALEFTVEETGGQDEAEFMPETELLAVVESDTTATDPQELDNSVENLIDESFGQGDGNSEGNGIDGASGAAGSFGKTGNAVTKGSFTVWTVPENPLPNEFYNIVIQVKLSKGLKSLRSTDLSGVIIGDDSKFDIEKGDYRQVIPWDKDNTKLYKPTGPYVKYRGRPLKRLSLPERRSRRRAPLLPIRDGYATLIMKVLGGAQKVTDTVVIKSKMLKESQTLKIQY